MKRVGVLLLLLVAFALCSPCPASAQQITKENCFYLTSLHYTARGMSYWYDKAQGGLETLTGVPYAQAGCTNCHVSSCDACHRKEVQGKPVYDTKMAKEQGTCLKCHGRESLMITKIDKESNTPDVHFAKGMSCTDCHTAREIHGDGVERESMKAPGAMDAKCENCHPAVSKSLSHTAHGNRLHCNACHVRHVVSCNNCHWDTMIKEKKRVSRPLYGWKFLMNYNGQVTSANMQTFIAPQDRVLMMFAPMFSHSVKKDGSRCEECHASGIVKDIQKGRIVINRLEGGKETNLKGIIPVVDGVRYDLVYHNFADNAWTPIANPVVEKVQYVGYGTPLTKEQIRRMASPQKMRAK